MLSLYLLQFSEKKEETLNHLSLGASFSFILATRKELLYYTQWSFSRVTRCCWLLSWKKVFLLLPFLQRTIKIKIACPLYSRAHTHTSRNRNQMWWGSIFVVDGGPKEGRVSRLWIKPIHLSIVISFRTIDELLLVIHFIPIVRWLENINGIKKRWGDNESENKTQSRFHSVI